MYFVTVSGKKPCEINRGAIISKRMLITCFSYVLAFGIDEDSLTSAGDLHLKMIIVHDSYHIVFSRNNHIAIYIHYATLRAYIVSPVFRHNKLSYISILMCVGAVIVHIGQEMQAVMHERHNCIQIMIYHLCIPVFDKPYSPSHRIGTYIVIYHRKCQLSV